MQPTFQNPLHHPVPAQMGAVGAPDGDSQVHIGCTRHEVTVVARVDGLRRKLHRRRVGVDPREQIHDAHRTESPTLRIRDATPHRGVGPVAVRPRRIQADEHHARPVRPAVIPIVAVKTARAEDGMVGSGGQECGERLHGERSCRMLADARGKFRDNDWGQTKGVELFVVKSDESYSSEIAFAYLHALTFLQSYGTVSDVSAEVRLQSANHFSFLVATHAPDDAGSSLDNVKATNRGKVRACQKL